MGQQTGQGGLVPPAPAGGVEVGRDGEIDVRDKTSDETKSQRHKAQKRQLLFKLEYKCLTNHYFRST